MSTVLKSHPLEATVAAVMESHRRSKPFLMGVSGGRDSMALLHVLKHLDFQNLIVCHLDHGLRGRASRADAVFVAKQTARMGFVHESARSRTREFAQERGCSLEAAARELRHAFYRECGRRHRCRCLLLAHHADDQVETCLFNFLRGSGPAGLAGMKPDTTQHGLRILRPLLEIPRDAIDAYVNTHGISFREDHTNAESTHTRNRIRNLVMPVISRVLGGSCRQAILRASDIFRHEEEWMEALTPEVSRELSCAALREMPEALRRRTVLRWLRKNRVPEPGFAETRRVLSLLNTGAGPSKVSLPGNLHARRRAGVIFLGREGGQRAAGGSP